MIGHYTTTELQLFNVFRWSSSVLLSWTSQVIHPVRRDRAHVLPFGSWSCHLRLHRLPPHWSMGFTQLEGTSICPFCRGQSSTGGDHGKLFLQSMGSCQRKDLPSVHSIDLFRFPCCLVHASYIVVFLYMTSSENRGCVNELIRSSAHARTNSIT